MPTTCPCGSTLPRADCCGRVIDTGSAATAEALMRSRFTAFTEGDTAHLLHTWHPSTRPARLDLDPDLQWVRLEVLSRTGGGLLHAEGTVSFRAHFLTVNGPDVLVEDSRFTRFEGQWKYLAAR
ncbi:YchJ family protein [Actinokineospora bangkokensis]|uniref:YchJ-like middle NTF2-like domain-containing protein n=1 Tax=Actinokineospora bangkokensis TaxID=1193682 RepID=A0A1Q9LQP5_9PSEU|nr:YchJ family metal-binding protein [Actinokineospora bangkokensis]OLR94323.1 hypothetical protein BJP25_11175 [Actinokineospora bangkokensis]